MIPQGETKGWKDKMGWDWTLKMSLPKISEKKPLEKHEEN